MIIMSSMFKYAISLINLVYCTYARDLYSLSVLDAHGKTVSLEQYRGQVTLIVNVASECGFTDGHYKALVNTKNLLKDTGKFEILAFPCNQFHGHEPKDIGEILEFAQTKFGANFPIFAKLNVHGDDVAEIYKYLHEKSGHSPTWNFWKYLINHNGEVIGFWGPRSDVQGIYSSIMSAVEAALEEEKMPKIPPSSAHAGDDVPGRRPISASMSGVPVAAPPQPSKAPVTSPPPVDRSRSRLPVNEPRPPAPAPSRGSDQLVSPTPPPRKHEDL
ncbi:hypothetical protein LSH36_953g00061 [Paralvinella palmiformis]|uniref:Glutathione peroxidase n=1 Tax=Paralvinella palmiformis TaxID=53620 RepID=A0AAD9IY50_9ANNE|nr:hypothetical protein LSH36_953g00061 [Paralvinella palmiformis]